MHEVGVLFVHGIGDHTEGHTLSSMGGALVESFDHSSAFTVTDRSTNGDEISFRLSAADTSESASVLFREAHWDGHFEAPPLRRVIAWSLIVTPWILHREALRWSARRRQVSKREAAGLATGYISIAIFLLRFLLFMALSLLVQVVVLASLLFIWLPFVRRALHRSFVLTIGDAYAFVHDDPALTAMAGRVHSQLEALGRQCQRTMVIAHSQGAAVTQRAIAQFGAPPELSEVVTLGAGIGKLTALRDLATRPAAMAYWAFARYAFIGIVGFAVSRESTYATEVTSAIGAGLFVALVFAPVWGSFRADRMAASIVAATPQLGTGWTWVDLWSPRDLVPDGRLRCGHHVDTGAVETAEISTKRSWLSAHVHYFTSEECLNILANLIAHPAPKPTPEAAPWAPPVVSQMPDSPTLQTRGIYAPPPSTPTPEERASRSRRVSILTAVLVSMLIAAATAVFVWKISGVTGSITRRNRTREIVHLLRDPAVFASAVCLVLLPGILLDAVPLRRPGRRRQRIRSSASVLLTVTALSLAGLGLASFTVLLHSVRATPGMQAGDCFDIPRSGLTANDTTPGSEVIVEYIALPCDEEHFYKLGSIDLVGVDLATATEDQIARIFDECNPAFPLAFISQEQVSNVSTSTWRLCFRFDGLPPRW
jgi:hypothetical protein